MFQTTNQHLFLVIWGIVHYCLPTLHRLTSLCPQKNSDVRWLHEPPFLSFSPIDICPTYWRKMFNTKNLPSLTELPLCNPQLWSQSCDDLIWSVIHSCMNDNGLFYMAIQLVTWQKAMSCGWWCPSSLAKLVQVSPMNLGLIYGKYIYSYWDYKPTNITGGAPPCAYLVRLHM